LVFIETTIYIEGWSSCSTCTARAMTLIAMLMTTACTVIDAEAATALKVRNRLKNRTDIETAVVTTAGTAKDA